MERFKWKVFIIAFVAYVIVFTSVLALYELVDQSGSILLSVLFFAVIFLIFVLILILAFREVDKKNDDVEASRRYYYYSKPFVFRIDKKGNIKSVNKTIEENVYNHVMFTTIHDLQYDRQDLNILEEVLSQNPFNCRFKNVNGEDFFVRFLPVKARRGYYLIGEDVTEQYNLSDFHRTMALYNEITKIPNKNYLGIRLQEMLANQEQMKKRNALVSVSFSGFKNIPKLFGTRIGEMTQRRLAELIEESLELFKYNLFNVDQDNFIILFRDLNRYSDITDWLNNFSNRFERALEVDGNMFTIGLKAGVFNLEGDIHSKISSVDAYENVQLALRKAKESRRMVYSVYDIALGKTFSREQIMEVDLAAAIRKQEFTMHLQPQLNNISNKVIGFEALIRWTNPKYAYESPSTFIEIAERNNLIVDIGRYVVEETFKVAKQLERYNIRVSINISPVQLLQTGFVNDLMNSFQKYNLSKGSIIIEITETFLMESLDDIVDKISQIKRRGILIHLDNFGTGYSSMLYLKDLPIDGISISKDFIKNIASEEGAASIVAQIIKLAKSLELEVIAEGVEQPAQNTFLKDKGCNIIQGYLISKPLPIDEAIKFMLKYNNLSEKPSDISDLLKDIPSNLF